MHGWVTSQHEGCVSTMPTDKRLEYCTADLSLQGIRPIECRGQADKHGLRGAFRLDSATRLVMAWVTIYSGPTNLSISTSPSSANACWASVGSCRCSM